MSRMARRLWVGALLVYLQGCAHFVETNTIERFTAALQEQDLDALQGTVSEDFKQRALRLDESVDDLKVLRLPKGEMTVSEVQDLSDDEKLVVASSESSSRKSSYRLKKSSRGAWRVDDVLLVQERNGVNSKTWASEQMDLLATAREFITAWDQGRRQQALSIVTPEFADSINSLPPGYFETVAERIAGESASSSTLKPMAQMGEDFAIVRARRPTGLMVLSFELLDGRWKVSDVAVEARGDRPHVPSMRKLATVVRTSFDFLDAYAQGDRTVLSKVCTEQLFRRSLGAADLSAVPLPDVATATDDSEVAIHGGRAFVEVPGADEIVRIDLVDVKDTDDPEAPTKYRIEEVTVYELTGSRQEKRLSAFFTAHATMRLFHQAMLDGDLPVLMKLSTREFNQFVWQRLDERTVTLLDLPKLQQPPEIVATSFHGAVTQVDARVGEIPMTFELRNQGGELRVADVQLPIAGRPGSMTDTFQLTIGLIEFAEGVRTADIGRVQRNSSNDLNRRVWKQVDAVPPLGHVAVRHLGVPLTQAQADAQNAVLTLGDQNWGSRVRMVKQHGFFVVDNIELIAGVRPGQRVNFKETARMQIVRREQPMSNRSPAQSVAPHPQAGVGNTYATETAYPPVRGPIQSLQ